VPTGKATIRKVAGVPWYASLHVGRYKYIRTFETDEIEELYNLDTDPEELTNPSLDGRFSARVRTMRSSTVAEVKRTGAKLADRLTPVAKLPDQ